MKYRFLLVDENAKAWGTNDKAVAEQACEDEDTLMCWDLLDGSAQTEDTEDIEEFVPSNDVDDDED